MRVCIDLFSLMMTILAAVTLAPDVSYAEPLCDLSAPPLTKTWKRDDLNPDRPFFVRLGPDRYAVPWKYLFSRPRGVQSCEFSYPSVGLRFWLSDGSAPMEDGTAGTSFRPKEVGKDPSNPLDTVVLVYSSEHYENNSAGRVNPDFYYQFALGNFKTNTEKMASGLTKIIFANRAPSHAAFYFSNDEYSFYADCLLSRTCQVFVDLKKVQLVFRAQLETGAIDYHGELAARLSDFFTKWKVGK